MDDSLPSASFPCTPAAAAPSTPLPVQFAQQTPSGTGMTASLRLSHGAASVRGSAPAPGRGRAPSFQEFHATSADAIQRNLDPAADPLQPPTSADDAMTSSRGMSSEAAQPWNESDATSSPGVASDEVAAHPDHGILAAPVFGHRASAAVTQPSFLCVDSAGEAEPTPLGLGVPPSSRDESVGREFGDGGKAPAARNAAAPRFAEVDVQESKTTPLVAKLADNAVQTSPIPPLTGAARVSEASPADHVLRSVVRPGATGDTPSRSQSPRHNAAPSTGYDGSEARRWHYFAEVRSFFDDVLQPGPHGLAGSVVDSHKLKVPAMVDMFAGAEEDLFKLLRHKYNAPQYTFVAFAPSGL